MPLAHVILGQPHVSAHNAERDAINDHTTEISSLQDDVANINTSIANLPVHYDLLTNRPSPAAAGDRTLFVVTDQSNTLYQVQSGAWVKVSPSSIVYGIISARPEPAIVGDKALFIATDQNNIIYQVQSGVWVLISDRQIRATSTITTGLLAPFDITTVTDMPLSKGFTLYTIQTSRPARVCLYSTVSSKNNDAGRAIGVDPSIDGVILDYVTTDAAPHILSPLVSGANLEVSPTNNISMRVQNRDSISATVAVTLVFLGSE